MYTVFRPNDRVLPMQPGDIEKIIPFVLSQNGTLKGHLRD
jgi:hypothetical protein